MRYRWTDSGGCPSDPVASRPAMQEPGTARGGDGESRHAGRGLHGVGTERATDPRLHTPPGLYGNGHGHTGGGERDDKISTDLPSAPLPVTPGDDLVRPRLR